MKMYTVAYRTVQEPFGFILVSVAWMSCHVNVHELFHDMTSRLQKLK